MTGAHGRLVMRLAVALLLAVPFAAAGAQGDAARSPLRKRTTYEDLQMFSQVLNQIRVNHPDTVDTHDLLMAAIQGMVQAADPHSFVIPAVRLDTARERALREGKLHPVPITFRFVGGAPVVVAVSPGSDAAHQDLLPGDELVAIDGKPVRAQSATELDVVLAGPKGSRVALAFERRRLDGSVARVERAVRRQRVEEGTAVPTAFMLDSTSGYVRITTFDGDKVAEDLRAAIERLEKRGMQRLLLDLRDNGGGRLDQAARIAGEFLPAGSIVYTTEGRKAEAFDTARVSRSFWKKERRHPVILLVNAGTASASELLAGALQDHDRALIVGRPTFGKSLVMRGFPMTDGSVFVLVVGQLRTPCGRVVQRQYRDVTRRDYYRLSVAERDTAGRPSCRTAAGRVVYGGGGIYPDVTLADREQTPLWLARLREADAGLRWVGGWVAANAARLPGLEQWATAPLLPASALADFRAFAATQGLEIPADADTVLQRYLTELVAYARFGDEGYYRVAAILDPTVRDAAQFFGRAAELPGVR